RPAQRSLTVCTLTESPSDPLNRRLRQLRCLRCRFDCYRVERTSSRAGVTPAEVHGCWHAETRVKPNYRRRILWLPDLDHSKLQVLNSLRSPASRRVYEYAIDQFIAGYCSEPRLAFNRIVVVRYRMYLESRGLAANTINQQIAP